MQQELIISLESGPDATERTTIDMRNWIKQEKIPTLDSVERLVDSPKKGEMGIDPATALTIVLGSAAIVELVKSIHVWIQTRRPKTKMKITSGDKTIDIETNNVKTQEELISLVEKNIVN